MMHDSLGIPACFSATEGRTEEPYTNVTRSGQSLIMSMYQTKLAGQCRLITVTWCKNLLLHGLSVSVQSINGRELYHCKIEMKPWYFWRKQGCKRFLLDGTVVDVVWDLKSAKFNGETEPQLDYYVAVVCQEEVVLVLGNLKKDAYRKTRCRPALIEPILLSRKEHVFGKKKFATRVRFHEKGNLHEISVQCNSTACNSTNTNSTTSSPESKMIEFDQEMEIKVDGILALEVKHLQWKFRGNEFINLSNKTVIEVYWDVHDWLFGSGPRHGFFIFKPIPPSSPPSFASILTQEVESATSAEGDDYCNNNYDISDACGGGSSSFCFFLYAWKVE